METRVSRDGGWMEMGVVRHGVLEMGMAGEGSDGGK